MKEIHDQISPTTDFTLTSNHRALICTREAVLGKGHNPASTFCFLYLNYHLKLLLVHLWRKRNSYLVTHINIGETKLIERANPSFLSTIPPGVLQLLLSVGKDGLRAKRLMLGSGLNLEYWPPSPQALEFGLLISTM